MQTLYKCSWSCVPLCNFFHILSGGFLLNDDSIEYIDEREETESVKRQFNTQHMCDTLMLFVIKERLLNSQESTIYETLEHLCHGQDSVVNVSQLDSPGIIIIKDPRHYNSTCV